MTDSSKTAKKTQKLSRQKAIEYSKPRHLKLVSLDSSFNSVQISCELQEMVTIKNRFNLTSKDFESIIFVQ